MPSSDWLFPGATGGAKRAPVLAGRITRAILDAIGCKVHAHLMRHLAARTHLRAHPGAFKAVRQLLGHTSVNTTQIYADFDAADAARHFDEHLLRLRRQAEVTAGSRKLHAPRIRGSVA
jgi:site-specific recombinase XerC